MTIHDKHPTRTCVELKDAILKYKEVNSLHLFQQVPLYILSVDLS